MPASQYITVLMVSQPGFRHGFTGFIQGAHALEAVKGPVPAPRASTGAEARGTAWELRIGGQSRGTHPGAGASRFDGYSCYSKWFLW